MFFSLQGPINLKELWQIKSLAAATTAEHISQR